MDYHGPHPDRADPLARVLDQPLPEGRARESPPPPRVLRSLVESSMSEWGWVLFGGGGTLAGLLSACVSNFVWCGDTCLHPAGLPASQHATANPASLCPLLCLHVPPPPPPTTTHAAGGLLEAERSEHSVDDAPACDPASAPPGNLQRSGSGSMQPRLPPLPLADKLSAAVRALDVGSPHTANGVAQYLATSTNLRASQQRLGAATRLRSSFLQRPPAAVEDLYYR